MPCSAHTAALGLCCPRPPRLLPVWGQDADVQTKLRMELVALSTKGIRMAANACAVPVCPAHGMRLA